RPVQSGDVELRPDFEPDVVERALRRLAGTQVPRPQTWPSPCRLVDKRKKAGQSSVDDCPACMVSLAGSQARACDSAAIKLRRCSADADARPADPALPDRTASNCPARESWHLNFNTASVWNWNTPGASVFVLPLTCTFAVGRGVMPSSSLI